MDTRKYILTPTIEKEPVVGDWVTWGSRRAAFRLAKTSHWRNPTADASVELDRGDTPIIPSAHTLKDDTEYFVVTFETGAATLDAAVQPAKRETFVVPEGMTAVRDDEGRATGKLIATRGTTHGDFSVNSAVAQAIKDTIRHRAGWGGKGGWGSMSPVQRDALDMIAAKIGRIVAGDADFRDHWEDIAGYAQLVIERLPTPK